MTATGSNTGRKLRSNRRARAPHAPTGRESVPKTHPIVRWQEEDAAGSGQRTGCTCAARVGEPATNCPTAKRISTREQSRVELHAPPGCALVRQDEKPHHALGLPAATFERDLRSKAQLRVVASQRFFNRRELGLDFDDEEGGRRLVEREEVDRPTLTVFGVGNLRDHLPLEVTEEARRLLAEARVRPVQEPVDLAAPPAHEQDQLCIEHRNQPPEPADSDPFDPAALDARNQVLARTGALTDLALRKAEPVSQDSDGPSESQVVHRATMGSAAYLAIA